MKLTIFLIILFPLSAFSQYNQYESYEEIVNRLSSKRHKQLKTRVSTTIPQQKYHVSLGLTQGYIPLQYNTLTQMSPQGMSFGGGIPLISQTLFLEAFAKFFNTDRQGAYSSTYQQYEVRVNHKEPMDFAIVNFGCGVSNKVLDIDNPSVGIDDTISIPSLMFNIGVERQITNRVSLIGDFIYHRSVRARVDGKNSYEASFRLNYSL